MHNELTPQEPSALFRNSFLSQNLLEKPGFSLNDTPHKIKMDQNECPYDWPIYLKQKVTDQMHAIAWNRYPKPYDKELESMLAQYVGVSDGHILLSPGSNHLIAIVIDTFCRYAKGDVWIAHPSFPLYAEHCTFYDIPWKPWNLNTDLEYDLKALNHIASGSVVIFASPNNPVGNSLKYGDLENLLTQNPSSLFIADEAYFEFSNQPYTQLLGKYNNLLLIRTFSKTMGSAALRLGYLIAHPQWIEPVRKLMLPFLINPFTSVAAKIAIQDTDMIAWQKEKINFLKNQRKILFDKLLKIGLNRQFTVNNSEANFLLIKWPSQRKLESFLAFLDSKGCKARDISKGPGLSGCLRLSVGNEEENQYIVETFQEYYR